MAPMWAMVMSTDRLCSTLKRVLAPVSVAVLIAGIKSWQGWQYVAFVIDVYARRIVGWQQSSSTRTDFVLGALEQALYDRRPQRDGPLIHHSDRGSTTESLELATLEWVSWFNRHRLLEPIG